MSIDRGLFPNDIWIGVKARFPIAIADHHDGIGAGRFSFAGKNEPPVRGRDAERLEEIPGDETSLHRLGVALEREAVAFVRVACKAAVDNSGDTGEEIGRLCSKI